MRLLAEETRRRAAMAADRAIEARRLESYEVKVCKKFFYKGTLNLLWVLENPSSGCLGIRILLQCIKIYNVPYAESLKKTLPSAVQGAAPGEELFMQGKMNGWNLLLSKF